MKALAIAFFFSATAHAASPKCTCTCVVKDSDGTYSTKTATAPGREAAGEALKKKLGKLKCELSPECKGTGCKADST